MLGHNVRREYFAQHQLEVMHPGRTVLKTMEEVAGPAGRMPEVRAYLGTFLFGEDDVTKKVGVLSGGEKARLALARMLMDPAGLLLLDEPTNHLDMDSRAVLTEALRQFEGSVIFISHDRHLINAIGTKVVEVKDGQLISYPGDWEYYQWKKAQEADPHAEGAGAQPGAQHAAAASASAAAQRARRAQRRRRQLGKPAPARTVELGYQERKELSSRHRKVEKLIMEAEARQTELAATMSDPAHATDYEILSAASSEAAALAARAHCTVRGVGAARRGPGDHGRLSATGRRRHCAYGALCLVYEANPRRETHAVFRRSQPGGHAGDGQRCQPGQERDHHQI